MAMVAGRHAAVQIKNFCKAHDQTRQVQDQLLAKLIHHHSLTQFGMDFGFKKIKSYEDFTSAVPLGDYETLRPYMDRVFHGQTNALFPLEDEILMFSRTSGTTGEPKHIPVTSKFAAEMRRGFNIFGMMAIKDHPAAWVRPILTLSSPMQETTSPTGLPCGAISGLLSSTQKKIVRTMYPVPRWVCSISNPAVKYYTTLRYSIDHDVSIISTANPSSIIKLIETGQAHIDRLIRDITDGTLTPPGDIDSHLPKPKKFRPNPQLASRLKDGIKNDGELLAGHFWNVSFLANWTGGTLKLYMPRLKELFGDVPIRDIGLIASEGRFSLPMQDNTSAGVAEITSNFLEFIPAGEIESQNPTVLRAHELELGQEYFIVVTNWAALWRYNMDDRVRVVGRFGQSPVFEFLSRGLHTANITGEKITEHQVVEAMRGASGRMNIKVDRFVMQGKFAKTPHYELQLEKTDGLDVELLAQLTDKALSELNIEYAAKRSSGRLGSIVPIILPAGTLVAADAEKILANKGRIEQYKPQYLLTEIAQA